MLEVTQQPRQLLFIWPGWRLQFNWRQDRWQHDLSAAVGTEWRTVAASREGAADDVWPVSPAFQSAFLEKIHDDCTEIQLLGQAGKNHYSGAIRCDAARQIIEFDLAVRIQSAPQLPLTLSSYLIFADASQAPLPLEIEPIAGHPPVFLVSSKVSAAKPVAKQDGSAGWSDIVNLALHELPGGVSDRSRLTLRWKYLWRLGNGA